MRFDLAKEGEGGAAGRRRRRLVLGRRGRGESIGMEGADVVESDVRADVVERSGDDCLELCHVEWVTVTGRRHVRRERLTLTLSLSFLNTKSSQIPFIPRFGYPLTPIAGFRIGDRPSVPSRPSRYLCWAFAASLSLR